MTYWIGELTETPIGAIAVAVSELGLERVSLFGLEGLRYEGIESSDSMPPAVLMTAMRQINEYLHGQRRQFDLPIPWETFTPFQRQVLQICYAIPYGALYTYGELAVKAGNPKAARAVGGFMAHNPLPLVIPCHRVVGSDGKLHGFGAPGGLATKVWLHQLEGISF